MTSATEDCTSASSLKRPPQWPRTSTRNVAMHPLVQPTREQHTAAFFYFYSFKSAKQSKAIESIDAINLGG